MVPATAFELLAPPVQRWIWQQKWAALRDIQEKAIPAVLQGGDVVLSARTAAGKTEAAFLPLLTRVLRREPGDGFALLYVSPLKALINDQFQRLEPLFAACDMPLHRWHGDVGDSAKQRARARPAGAVLITPESLEAMLVRRPREVRGLFQALEAVVVDELHAFIGTERGVQLHSVLNRIEVASARDGIDRIGLSATLGDMRLAADALRPGGGGRVALVEGRDEGNGLRLQIKGYAAPATEDLTEQAIEEGAVRRAPPVPGSLEGMDDDREPRGHLVHPPLAHDLFRLLRGRTNLLFAGSRRDVEAYTDALRVLSEEAQVPNEFFAHHGSLDKAEREFVEQRLREDPRPTTAVATTTLELGIDIGDVETVAQIGPGYSVASLRQRLGRSGRRAGSPAILRVFVIEPELAAGGEVLDRLRLDLVQAMAVVACLIEGWCEPPTPGGLHLSTLLHQTLAVILQTGGLRPGTAWRLLCERGPFRAVDRGLYAELLRAMADRGLVRTSPDGLLMIAPAGEDITESHEFYTVFETTQDYRVVHRSRTLGTYPVDNTVAVGQTIIFAGRRWRIARIDDDALIIEVTPSRKVRKPVFSGTAGTIHDRIAATMRQVLCDSTSPVYLDSGAQRLLEEARAAFRELGLDQGSVIRTGEGVLLFPWVGTRKLETLALALRGRGFEASPRRHAIEVDDASPDGVLNALAALAGSPPPDGPVLAGLVAKPCRAKFDGFLNKALLERVLLAERLEPASVPSVAASLVGEIAAPASPEPVP